MQTKIERAVADSKAARLKMVDAGRAWLKRRLTVYESMVAEYRSGVARELARGRRVCPGTAKGNEDLDDAARIISWVAIDGDAHFRGAFDTSLVIELEHIFKHDPYEVCGEDVKPEAHLMAAFMAGIADMLSEHFALNSGDPTTSSMMSHDMARKLSDPAAWLESQPTTKRTH